MENKGTAQCYESSIETFTEVQATRLVLKTGEPFGCKGLMLLFPFCCGISDGENRSVIRYCFTSNGPFVRSMVTKNDIFNGRLPGGRSVIDRNMLKRKL